MSVLSQIAKSRWRSVVYYVGLSLLLLASPDPGKEGGPTPRGKGGD